MRNDQVSDSATRATPARGGLERLRITSERKPPGINWARWIAAGLATIAAFGGGSRLYHRNASSIWSSLPSWSSLPWSPRPAAASTETTLVVLRDLRSQDLVTAGGYAVTQSKVHLGSELTGKIKRLAVDKGDRVRSGDVIAELENESYRIEIRRCKADLSVAKANADRYKKYVDRYEGLLRTNTVSKDEVEEARRLADTSSIACEVAEARCAAASCEYNKTFIRSPLSGVVVKKFLNAGDTVSPLTPYTENMDTLCTGSPIVSLVDPSNIKVEVDVSEESIAKVKLGQHAEVIPTVHPEPRLEAEVCRIAVEANRKKHAIQVELRLKGPVPAYLKPEVEVKASIFGEGDEGGAACSNWTSGPS